jgi:translation initiation factor IF-3
MHHKFQRPQEKRQRINNFIKAPEVNVIDQEGNKLGTMPLHEALKKAQEAGLDLVEVSATTKPPMVKILDYGKYMYQKEKREREQKTTKPKGQELKIVKIGLKTGEHDLNVRAEQIDKFFEKGYRVKVELRLRGRERGTGDMGKTKIQHLLDSLIMPYTVEEPIKSSPSGFGVLIKPESKK